MAPSTDHCLVITTCGFVEEARTIARHLVEARLAAGVQIVPIESVYRWQDEVIEDDEWVLICKTRRARYPEIEAAVQKLHSYEVVPIYMIPIDEGSQPYLGWIDGTTAS